MWKHTPTNQTLTPGKAFLDENGRRHTAGWVNFSAEEKTSFGIAEIDFYNDPTPEFDPNTQKVVDGDVEDRAGDLYQTKVVVDLSAELIATKAEQRAGKLRGQRDAALAEGDWEIIRAFEKDLPVRAELKTYRDALRDLPEAVGFPDVELPVNPDAPVIPEE